VASIERHKTRLKTRPVHESKYTIKPRKLELRGKQPRIKDYKEEQPNKTTPASGNLKISLKGKMAHERKGF